MSLFQEITNDDIQKLPLRFFEGEIHVIDKDEDCAKALSILSKETVMGFDTEAKPTFHKGEYNPTTLVQLSTNDHAFLFRIHLLSNLKPLYRLLQNPDIIKLGISIGDDLKDLQRLHRFTPSGFIDLNSTAKEIGIKHMGVKKLAAVCLEYRISKNQQTSNWENAELTSAQQRYAATDAWICLVIYNKLKYQGYI